MLFHLDALLHPNEMQHLCHGTPIGFNQLV